MDTTTLTRLAIDGGPKSFNQPWPARHLLGQEEKAAVVALFDRAIAGGAAIGYNGPEEEGYCKAFAEFLGGGLADGVNSGSTAVYVAVRALELPAGSEVIVSPITDPGGVMPISIAGCVPVPADSAPGSFNTGAAQIADRITPRTKAILVAHIAGSPCHMSPIMELARTHGLKVIEDCAQAHGAICEGRPAGTWADVSAFSTMFGKHHCTGGQGGVVFTRDQDTYWKVRRYADRGKPFGIEGASSNVAASLNFNMDEFHAAIGCVQLKKLPGIVERRRASFQRLEQGLAQRLRAVRAVGDPAWGRSAVWFGFFTLDLSQVSVSKARFAQALAVEGLPVEANYVGPMTEHAWFQSAGLHLGPDGNPWPMPNLHAAAQNTFRIFWHENMSDATVDAVVDAFEKVERAYLL